MELEDIVKKERGNIWVDKSSIHKAHFSTLSFLVGSSCFLEAQLRTEKHSKSL